MSRRLGEVKASLSVKRMDREFELEERYKRQGSKSRLKEIAERITNPRAAQASLKTGKLEFRPALLPIPHLDLF